MRVQSRPVGPVAPDPTSSRRAGGLTALAAYVALTKPRIILLLLVTTIPSMVLAEGGVPSLWLMAATLIGGVMTAGGANALNHYLDRDIDGVMARTRRRPIPSHRVVPGHALVFGLALAGAGFTWLVATVNVPAAALAISAVAFYVVVYTVLLKRRSAQNIVIGGAAGGAPVLVGWAAVTGWPAAPAWLLFALVFLWTPPHFWALALLYRQDYAAAGVPMLPVVSGTRATTWQILIYAVAVTVLSLALVPVAHAGRTFLVSALLLGGLFVARAIRLHARPTRIEALRLFRYSIVYLAALFGAVAVDTFIRFGL
jgi:heme o synthase